MANYVITTLAVHVCRFTMFTKGATVTRDTGPFLILLV